MHAAAGTILFRRDYQGLTGGHLKVWDYFRHARHSARFQPRIFLTGDSLLDASNPWLGVTPPPLAVWDPAAADVLFVAGVDWEAIPARVAAPVVNLIQGVRHADPADPRRRFLSRPAIRICVGAEIADAIRSTGLVNGPIHVIPNGLDTAAFPPQAKVRDIPVLVAGGKNPAFAAALAGRLAAAGLAAECLMAPIPRDAFLGLLGRARTVVTLPLDKEGFFLPALEAMAMGAVVVCPDCVGNRGFCRDGVTCLRPTYALDAVAEATIAAAALSDRESAALKEAAEAKVRFHGIERERMAFLHILDAL
jgi:glycosyltransferase involved in cell wall biosynthesis